MTIVAGTRGLADGRRKETCQNLWIDAKWRPDTWWLHHDHQYFLRLYSGEPFSLGFCNTVLRFEMADRITENEIAQAHTADTEYFVRRGMTKGYQIASLVTPPIYAAFVLSRYGRSHLTVNRILRSTWVGGATGMFSVPMFLIGYGPYSYPILCFYHTRFGWRRYFWICEGCIFESRKC